MSEYEKLAQDALELADKATPGPWCVDWTHTAVRNYFKCGWQSFADHKDAEGKNINYKLEDAELMCAGRFMVPSLAKVVLVLSQALKLATSSGGIISGKTPEYWIEVAQKEMEQENE